MRYCDWDEVLDRDGLLILTEEALTPPRRSRAPMRRLAAAAACAGLAPCPRSLCQAQARYFSRSMLL